MIKNTDISKLADKLTPEFYDYLLNSDELLNLFHESAQKFLDGKFGEMDDDLFFDLGLILIDRVYLTYQK